MTNFVIAGILVIMVILGIRSSIKHFKREGGCCGGGSSVAVKKKRLKQVVKQRIVMIEGMTCKNCKKRVESRLNAVLFIFPWSRYLVIGQKRLKNCIWMEIFM